MTRIIGAPLAQGNPPTKMTIQEEAPYQGGPLGLSPGRYEATYDHAARRWVTPSGNELVVLMPRRGQNDPAATGSVTLHITANYDNPDLSRTARLMYTPATWAETAEGVFDLSVNPEPVAWVATAGLSDLITQTQAAQQAAQDAAQQAEAKVGAISHAEQAALDAAAAAGGAADVIGAAGLLYLGIDSDGAATLGTVEPRATVTTETTDWPLIGQMSGPVLTIGGQ